MCVKILYDSDQQIKPWNITNSNKAPFYTEPLDSLRSRRE